ncbi:MAG: GAF domain-containing sensor histidine kinase [bacterium]|nr:GAF domain-containing sensor histidine kinase [bacterium]
MSRNNSHGKDVNIILANLKEIAEAVMYAAEGGTLEQVLQRIAYVTQQVSNARYTALGVPDGKGSLKYFKVVGVTEATIHEIGHPPVGRGLLGAIMHERETLRLDHMQTDPRSVGFPEHHPSMESLLGVPIQVGDHLFGMLYLCDRLDGKPFDEQDQWLVETLAGYAALAIAGVQLGEQQQRLVLLEERERVGMELHDGIIQSLYAIGMHLQLQRLSGEITLSGLDDAVRNLDAVIEDIRRYILNLRLSNYHQKSVRECLEDMMARLHVPETLDVTLDAPDSRPPLSPPVFEAVCQIAQEAVSNVIRHAGADRLCITVNHSDALFTLTVEDNGRGFDLNAPREGEGLGLRNIQQRARIHAGKVSINSTPGKGTRLTLTLPLA